MSMSRPLNEVQRGPTKAMCFREAATHVRCFDCQ